MFKWIGAIAKASGTSGAFTSLGVMGPIIAMILMAVNIWYGSIGGEGDLISQVELQSQINNVIAIIGFGTAVYGRIRATNRIGGGKLQ